MNYRYQKPHSLLSPYVRTVLILEGFVQPDKDLPTFFTNGMPVLLCRTQKAPAGNEHVTQLTLFGKSTLSDSWTIDEQTTLIAYFFNPFALAALFTIPAVQLAAAPVDLGNWNAHLTTALRTQLIYAGSTARKIKALDHLLIRQLQQNNRECAIIRYATDQIMYDPGTEILANLLDQLDFTERTFQRLFKKYVGITPNRYRRICQFQLSFTQLRANDFDKLTDVAYDKGFADQAILSDPSKSLHKQHRSITSGPD